MVHMSNLFTYVFQKCVLFICVKEGAGLYQHFIMFVTTLMKCLVMIVSLVVQHIVIVQLSD